MSDIIAIDGPAGAGKSTVARLVANRLNFMYLDTGAMYRSVAWLAIKNRVAFDDESALVEVARDISIEFGELTPEGTQSIKVNAVNATEAIRTPEVSSLTSYISSFSAVRKLIVAQQRDIAESSTRGVVLEGRDIGTVVFPNALLKVFLTASAEERANRRVSDLISRGTSAEFAKVLQDQIERDQRDSSREASPLVPAADSIHLNTDGITVDEVVQTILKLYRDKVSQSEITVGGTTDGG